MIDSKISLCVVYVKNLLYFNHSFNILIMINILERKKKKNELARLSWRQRRWKRKESHIVWIFLLLFDGAYILESRWS